MKINTNLLLYKSTGCVVGNPREHPTRPQSVCRSVLGIYLHRYMCKYSICMQNEHMSAATVPTFDFCVDMTFVGHKTTLSNQIEVEFKED